MRMERLKVGPITYLAFRGAFRKEHVAWTCGQLGAVLEDGERNIVLNFRRVEGIDPEPLQSIFEFQRQLLDRQGTLVISSAPTAVRSAFLLAAAEPPILFADDDASAAHAFAPSAPPPPKKAASTSSLRVRLEAKEDHHVLGWWGELDPSELGALRSGIDTLLQRGATHIVLNLSRVEFITSAGIAFIMELHEQLRGWGGRLVISDPAPFIRKTFNVLGFDEAIRIVDSDDEAAHYLRKREVPERSAVELTSRHAKKLGTSRVEFQLFDTPDQTAVGRLLYLWSNGLAFAYPSEWGHSSIDASRIGLHCPLRMRIPHSVPGAGDEGRWRLLEMEGEVEMTRAIEDDAIDALQFRVRYTRISNEDREYLDLMQADPLDES